MPSKCVPFHILIVLWLTFFVSSSAFCQGVVRLIPEWNARHVVIVDIETTFKRIWNPKKNSFGGKPAVLFERLNMIKTLTESLGPDKVILTGSKISLDPLQDWLRSTGKMHEYIEIFQSRILDNEAKGAEDEWVRDYIGFPATNGKTPAIAILNPRGESASTALGALLGIDTVRFFSAGQGGIEGGNLMVDEKMNCFSTTPTQNLVQAGLCRQMIQLEPLPFEGTHHIDLFAKLIGSNRVLISEYLSNQVDVLKQVDVTRYNCSQEIHADSPDFDFMTKCVSDSLPEERDFTLSSNRVLIQDIPMFVKRNFPYVTKFFAGMDGLSATTAIDDIDWSRSLVSHSLRTIDKFQNLGLKPIRIFAPPPILQMGENVYYSTEGKLIRREVNIELVFRSYTNSLQFNSKLFLPSYDATVPRAVEQAVLDQLRGLDLDLILIPANNSVFGGGAIHCLTREL